MGGDYNVRELELSLKEPGDPKMALPLDLDLGEHWKLALAWRIQNGCWQFT